jgi:hypothetical protein
VTVQSFKAKNSGKKVGKYNGLKEVFQLPRERTQVQRLQVTNPVQGEGMPSQAQFGSA